SFGGGVKVLQIADCTTVPTTNPSGGGLLYCEGGALKYRGSSGSVTTIALHKLPRCPPTDRLKLPISSIFWPNGGVPSPYDLNVILISFLMCNRKKICGYTCNRKSNQYSASKFVNRCRFVGVTGNVTCNRKFLANFLVEKFRQ